MSVGVLYAEENNVTDPCLKESRLLDRDECYLNAAQSKGDLKLCEKISTFIIKESCKNIGPKPLPPLEQ